MARHFINYKKVIVKKGRLTAVYPFYWRGKPFVGRVERVRKNKYGRYSYVINGREWSAEELFPDNQQQKLKVPYEAIHA